MLSILIPVFDFDIRQLVEELHTQCLDWGGDFEIICLDDASAEKWQQCNQEIKDKSFVQLIILEQNIGRSAIRNQLARMAAFEYLLFMDCDSRVNHRTYIQQYMEEVTSDCLVYGGRNYGSERPSDHQFIFHWIYGKNREESTADDRRQKPYHSFMTNNFVIPKKIFFKYEFDESIRAYGHEDTVFGFNLKDNQECIKHIDNPLEHIGLEPTEKFIAKSKQAVRNLYYITKKYPNVETKLLSLVGKFDNHNVSKIFANLGFITPYLEYYFNKSSRPNLLFFDLYKLLVFYQIKYQKGGNECFS